ncbi:MAG TPA: metallophosphoesterase family protein [Planctomycetota bacterium]|nr:metallophosphoesterase family protein [Planctomycetota bacterium]
MLAIISDLHANLEAVTAVLDDVRAQGADKIYCLGDVVGYGPDPVPVTDLVRERAEVCLEGNHDEALHRGPLGFNPPAAQVIYWTVEHMKPGFFSGVELRKRWDYITTRPQTHRLEADLFVHGSPLDPTSGYLLMQDLNFGPTEKYEQVFAETERLIFCGHTHLPCVITDDFETKTSKQLENTWTWEKGKAIVNVGSVGQPRDGDARASYVLFDGKKVTWRRVPYAFEQTSAKVQTLLGIEKLAERLKVGV